MDGLEVEFPSHPFFFQLHSTTLKYSLAHRADQQEEVSSFKSVVERFRLRGGVSRTGML